MRLYFIALDFASYCSRPSWIIHGSMGSGKHRASSRARQILAETNNYTPRPLERLAKSSPRWLHAVWYIEECERNDRAELGPEERRDELEEEGTSGISLSGYDKLCTSQSLCSNLTSRPRWRKFNFVVFRTSTSSVAGSRRE
jgi:hypothetical protein